MAVYLVCESELGGLDMRVLEALVVQHHNLMVQIEPKRGVGGLGPIREFLRNRPAGSTAISVEDRGYRPRGLAEAHWGNLAETAFIWRRHEIENYLLQPRVVLALFDDYRATFPTWAANLPATEALVSALLQSLAAPLIEDHAGHTLEDELFARIDGHRLRYRVATPAAASGSSAPGQAQWLPALQGEANRLASACTTATALPELQAPAIQDRLSQLLTQFQAPAFLTSNDYLIDMGGHQWMAALSRHLSGLGAPTNFAQDFLANELLRVLQLTYQPNLIYQPDDFAELAAILRQYVP